MAGHCWRQLRTEVCRVEAVLRLPVSAAWPSRIQARLWLPSFALPSQQARKKLGLKTPKKERKLPQLLSEAALQRFFRVIQDCGDVQHESMLKFLFYTAVWVSELVGIRVFRFNRLDPSQRPLGCRYAFGLIRVHLSAGF
jgi:integrase